MKSKKGRRRRTSQLPPEPHHGFPTLEAEAGLDVVAAFRTFRGGVVVQNPTGEPLQGQITCGGASKGQLEADTCHTSGRKRSEEEERVCRSGS